MPLSVVFVLSVRRYLLKRFTSLQDPVLQRQVIAHICARLSLQSWRKWGVRNLQRVIFKIKCAHRQCLWLHIIYPWETARATERERELCISVILLLFVKSACKLVETNLQFRIIHLLALSFELKFKAF